jgi:MscS family membrane protein
MKQFLATRIFDNSIALYLEVFGVILLAIIVKRILSKYLAGLLFRLFSKNGKTFHKKEFIELILGPLEAFLFVTIVIIALDKLTLPSILNVTVYKVTTREILDALVHTTLIVVFIRFCIRLIRYLSIVLEDKANLTADQTDNQLIVFFGDFFKVIVYLTGFLLILRFTFNYDISKLITGLSIVGAAIALATKESLENLIASFIIFFDKPFTTGDLVKVQGFTGTVEKIGLRSTRIRTDHKTYITVPNKQMVDTILDNISLRSQRRAELKLELETTTTAATLQQLIPLIRQLLNKPFIENETVFLSDTGKNGHVITIEFFASMEQSLQEFIAIREEINFQIIELLQAQQIQLVNNAPNIIVPKP